MSIDDATHADLPDHSLIWIDLEMTGLDTGTDEILEIATIVTDGQLNVLAEGPELAIAHPLSALEAMDDGEYGVCVVCCKDIPFERLKVEPMTQHCIVDKAKLEKQARA